jgi:hypothetical protein
VDYRSLINQPQRLNELMALLTKSRFRMDFRVTNSSPWPLLTRHIESGIDSRL